MDDAKRHFTELGAEGLSEIAKEYGVNDDLEFLKKFLNKTDKSLDLGCGYGRTAIPLLEQGYNILGIDITPNLVKEAQRQTAKLNLGKNRFEIGDMRNLPYKDDVFNKVFSLWNSFNHILSESDQIKVFNETHRVLRPGGAAFLSTLDGEQKLYSSYKNKTTKMKTRGSEATYFIHDRAHLEGIARRSNFTRFQIGFKYMNNRRRIVAYLIKSE